MGAVRLAAPLACVLVCQTMPAAFDRCTCPFGERRKARVSIGTIGRDRPAGLLLSRAPEPRKISKDKGGYQRHLDYAGFIVPAKNLMAKEEQGNKKGDCDYVHRISPTPAAWQ